MTSSHKKSLTAFMIAMINISAVCNIANLSIHAQNGFSAIFFLAIASLFFFLPVALISAELGSAWPQRGGVFIWVKEALGSKYGFLAIWLQWAENIFWYPTSLSFVAATFAYIFSPSLAENKFYITFSVLILFWSLTIINFLGIRISGLISSICASVGALFPGFLIIILGTIWLFFGNKPQLDLDFSFILHSANNLSQLGLFAGILISLGGLEMSANHAKELINPKKSYPVAILTSAALIFLVFSLGSLSIAIVLPKEKIQLASGSLEAFKVFLESFHMGWAVPLIASFVSIGALGMISTWIVGPSRGVFATAEYGELPPFLQKSNKRAMPVTLLLIQAGIVSVLSLVFIFMPSVSSSYWMLFCLTAQLYLLMYILLFISGIILRFKKPNVERSFKIPFKNIGMIITALTGTLCALFGFFMGFFPPDQFKTTNIVYFICFLVGGNLLFIIAPLFIASKKHPDWIKYYKEKTKFFIEGNLEE